MNAKKSEKIQLIAAIMHGYNISIDEIEEALEVFEVKNRAFDLLCHINGAPKRVRFDCGKHFSPIGIFPFEDDDFYIIFKHLGEESNRHNINNKRLPVLEDLARICEVKEQLNKKLKELKMPEIRGEYLAFTPVYLKEDDNSWVVTFEDDNPKLGRKTHGYDKVAKICYFGRWD